MGGRRVDGGRTVDLAAFEGLWHLTRTIEDIRAGQGGSFLGTARFTPAPSGLAYVEEGALTLGAAAPMTATRRYLWRAAGDAIEIDFEDGRFFHAFPAGQPSPAAEHFCDPDHYSVRYDFTRWPDWRAEWRVTGPRKEYRMSSAYRRAS